MDKKKYQDEFEQFLQDEVKQHRMYPADRVWSNIRTELHGHRAWPALTFISLFVITALTITTILNTQHQEVHLQPVSIPDLPLLQQQQIAANEAASEKSRHYFNSIAHATTTIVHHGPALTQSHSSLSLTGSQAAILSDQQEQQRSTHATISAMNNRYVPLNPVMSIRIPSPGKTELSNLTTAISTNMSETGMSDNADLGESSKATTPVHRSDLSNADPNADSFLDQFGYVAQENRKIDRKPSKFGFQFYITPSTSYRKLSDEKVKEVIQPAIANAQPASSTPVSQTGNINQVVRHKPAMGLELGFGIMYNITNRLKLKTGVQLNIRQYQIETYRSASYDRATISLINFRGVENITRLSPYNNNVGYREATLDNKVYQLSVPLGLQWDILKSKNWSINTEASVQPTLNLNKNVYLLSTDYKHYAEGNDFVRRWNVNTALGFNISYTAGKTSWQIGPQVRYQHLSTYSNKYPIREYLMDYGLRIGFTKALQ